MKKIFKKQDVFDISSCENIHINCKGYFFDKIPKDLVIPKSKDAFFLKVIDSLTKNCFGYVPLWESGDKAVFYPYFVPESLVFEKPEPRPFKNFKECFKYCHTCSSLMTLFFIFFSNYFFIIFLTAVY